MKRTNMKWLGTFMVAVLLIVGVLGCSDKAKTPAASSSNSESPSSSSPESAAPSQAAAKPIKYGVSVANLNNPFYLEIKEGMESALKSGDSVNILDANLDQAKQLNDIEDMITQKYDVILIDPVDSKGVQPILEKAKAANIPVIAFNSPVDASDLVSSTVASDNYMAGQLAGEALAKKMGGKGNVATYNYSVVKVVKDRSDGFEDAMKKFPDIKIVNRQEGLPSVDAALPIMENILQSNPDLQGVFALNDPAAIGCIAAIESAGKTGSIFVVGVDGSAEGKKMIGEGKMLGSSAQFPKKIGSISIETAYKLLAGEKVEKDIKVPVSFVDSTNL